MTQLNDGYNRVLERVSVRDQLVKNLDSTDNNKVLEYLNLIQSNFGTIHIQIRSETSNLNAK